MEASERVVIGLPLDGLWDSAGTLEASKVRELTGGDIKDLLRMAPVAFVVADVGRPLRWVTGAAQCFGFWKTDAQPHLYERAKPYLDNYPDGYFYTAYEWRLCDERSVVVLEKHH
jgi:hypothetical protein